MTCAKRTVTCTLTFGPGSHDVITATNECANPQTVCPRLPGEGYEKCKTICQQSGHAEINALAKAQAAGIDLRHAVATVSGHYWMCEPCGAALRAAGIKLVCILSESPLL